MEDCQDASGSSSEVYSGVAGRIDANPPVADPSTSTDTVQPTVSRKPDVGRPMEMLPGGNTSSISSLFSADVASFQGEADIYEICTDRQVGSGGGGDDDPWSCNKCSLFNQSSNRRCQKCGCENMVTGGTSGFARGSGSSSSYRDLRDNGEISSVAKSSKVDGNDTSPSLPPVRGSEDQSAYMSNNVESSVDSQLAQARSHLAKGEYQKALDRYNATFAALGPSEVASYGSKCANGIARCLISNSSAGWHGISARATGGIGALVYHSSNESVTSTAVLREVQVTTQILKAALPDKGTAFYTNQVVKLLSTSTFEPGVTLCSEGGCTNTIIDNRNGNTKCQRHRKCSKPDCKRKVHDSNHLCQIHRTEQRKADAQRTDIPGHCAKVGCGNKIKAGSLSTFCPKHHQTKKQKRARKQAAQKKPKESELSSEDEPVPRKKKAKKAPQKKKASKKKAKRNVNDSDDDSDFEFNG